jgi:hypothetical protein
LRAAASVPDFFVLQLDAAGGERHAQRGALPLAVGQPGVGIRAQAVVDVEGVQRQPRCCA